MATPKDSAAIVHGDVLVDVVKVEQERDGRQPVARGVHQRALPPCADAALVLQRRGPRGARDGDLREEGVQTKRSMAGQAGFVCFAARTEGLRVGASVRVVTPNKVKKAARSVVALPPVIVTED